MLSLESVLGFCHGIVKGGDCKVEFNQPSCWLYSMPNLLVFQQLETLYLGGNHVKVVCVRECEELLKCVQRSRDSRLDFAGDSRLQATRLKHTCQACQKLKRHASCSLQDRSPRLARPFSTQSRVQATRTPCLAKYDFSHSFSPYSIYTFIPSIQRELLKIILREKP